jgi:amino acid adenylation domain-containing protein
VLLAGEVLAVYRGGSESAPDLSYAEAAKWWWETLGARDADGVRCWDDLVPGSFRRTRTTLERQHPDLKGGFHPRSIELSLGADGWSFLRAVAGSLRVDVADVALALWSAFLGRYHCAGPEVIGLLDDGRFLDDLRGVIGPLERMLPISVPAPDRHSLSEVTRAAAARRREARELGDYFHLDGDRKADGTPDVIPYHFEWRNVSLPGSERLVLCESRGEPFRLKLSGCSQGESTWLTLDYDPRFVDAGRADDIARRFARLCREALASPERPIGHFGLNAPATSAVGATARGEDDLVRAFASAASRFPQRIAVSGGGEVLTYADLSRASDAAAMILAAAGAGPGSVVGLAIPRTVDSITAMLGILKCGAAFLPLDPAWPASRRNGILQQSGAQIVICSADQAGSADGLQHVSPPFHAERVAALHASIFPDSPAYVLYTSGSTGTPKGAINTHRAVVALAEALQREILAALGGPLRIAVAASFSFDASIQQIFSAILLGHQLVIVPEGVKRDPARMTRFLAEEQVAVCDGTPALLGLLSGGDSVPSDRLRHMIIGGDSLTAAVLQRFHQSPFGQSVAVTNIYGLTESGVDSVAYMVTPGTSIDSESVPVGTALPNSDVWLLNDCLEPVPDLALGEIYIGGPCLALGYLNDPASTADRFVPCPFRAGERMLRTGDRARRLPGGELVFESRRDSQVKVRGHRIETAEIAAAIARHSSVREALVLPHHSADGLELAGFYTGTPAPDVLRIRTYLRALLPDYMVPRWLFSLAEFPLNRSGKPDREALSAMIQNGHARTAPASFDSCERILAIWRRVLGIASLGPDDDFFHHGGHSLLALRAVAQMSAELGPHFELHQLYEHSTARQFLESVCRSNAAGARRSGHRELLLLPPLAGLPSVFDDVCVGFPAPLESFGIAYQPAETLDQLVDGVVERVLNRSGGPYRLAGHSFGAVVCFEAARKLEALGHATRVALLDRPVSATGRGESVEQSVARLLAKVPEFTKHDLEERIRRHRAMLTGHRLNGSIRGDLLSIEAADSEHAANMHEWKSRTTGRFRHEFTGGDHDSMLQLPHASRVAALLSEWFSDEEVMG